MSELAQRIEGLCQTLEYGDGGARGDFKAALAEVDKLVQEVERLRTKGLDDFTVTSDELSHVLDQRDEWKARFERLVVTAQSDVDRTGRQRDDALAKVDQLQEQLEDMKMKQGWAKE